MKRVSLLVISADYPGPDNIYGDVFVHTRLKEYLKFFDVKVVGYNAHLTAVREYVYDTIPVFVTPGLADFYSKVRLVNADVIVGHLVQHHYLDFLLSLEKPLAVFMHGYETTSWGRRLMNYDSLGSLRYLWGYILSNRKQLNGLFRFVREANKRRNIRFVFVSNWLKEAAQSDLRKKFKYAHVIPNGIDTSLFSFQEKADELRKKVLVLRSFKAKNYANDITIDAILLLSKKSFFNELEFCIYGEGYLFKPLTDKIKHFSNVTLNNFFVENKTIPSIHRGYGVFLCPSRLDTQGVSMCEAMASGLVPVTSPVGGIPEYASDGISSFQVWTAQEMADKIEYLYHNPSVFQEMSKQARQAIVHTCSLQSVVSKEIKLIQALADPSVKIDLEHKECTRCVLDTDDDPEITFDDTGVCSYCRNYLEQESMGVKKGEEGEQELAKIIAKIKEAGKDKKYDCILGLSGGVDSTYLAYQTKKLGLRPLAVHFDNGWNSELAVNNIENIIDKLKIDLHTLVIDWEEFRDLQLAFLKASVVDIEMVTDHAILATLYSLALKHNIKYILSGTNVVTEAVLPQNWIHKKGDYIHIRAINKQFNKRPLKSFPLFDLRLRTRAELRGIRSVSILNYIPYNKEKAKEEILRELSWRDYGGKHYESVFTRFYQGYILPTKFGIDKRKAHVSNLICSKQITRQQALEELKKPIYNEAVLKSDYQFVLKKLNLSEEEFESIMKLPVKQHSDYPVEQMIYERFPFLKVAGPLWRKIKLVKSRI